MAKSDFSDEMQYLGAFSASACKSSVRSAAVRGVSQASGGRPHPPVLLSSPPLRAFRRRQGADLLVPNQIPC
jgi:hypothetical protein